MSIIKVDIETYSHGFSVMHYCHDSKEAVRAIVMMMVQWGWIKTPPYWKPKQVIKRTYTGRTPDGRRWFSIFLLDELLRQLRRRGISQESISITTHPIPPPVLVYHPINDNKRPRDYQVPLIEYFVNATPLSTNEAPGGKLTVTNLQTGKGKTFVALQAMADLGMRTIIQMKGGYIHRWLDDLEELFEYEKNDIMVIRGSEAMKSVMFQAMEGTLEAKVMILSTRTYQKYLKVYERDDGFDYPVKPHWLMGTLGVGLRIIDEVHEDFHLQMKSNIYSHCEQVICLSATLETDDPLLKQLYHYSLPKDYWYHGIDYDAYVGVIALHFGSHDPGNEVTTIRGSDNYSHAAYEQWIMLDEDRLGRYLKIILDSVLDYYLQEDYDTGQRCLIFCSLTDFCEVVTGYLSDRLPEFKVETYIGESDPIVLKTADIIVSTVGSSGTAVDIDGLRTMILTRAINRREANEQIKGRGRRLKDWPHVTPLMVYYVNKDIPKHRTYHRNKMEQYKGKVAFHETRMTNAVV